MPDEQPVVHPHETERSIAQLKKELAEAQARAEEHLQGWKRAKADFINFKKDLAKEQEALAKYATAGLLADLLPVADHFRLAIQHLTDEQKKQDWCKGIIGIQSQLASVLKSAGLEEVKTEGQFNPEYHEAVTHEKKDGVPSGTIVEVVQPGYLLHGRLFRPARVKVAK